MPTRAAIRQQKKVKELIKRTKAVIATRCVEAEARVDRLQATIDDLNSIHAERANGAEQELQAAREETATHKQTIESLKHQVESVVNELQKVGNDRDGLKIALTKLRKNYHDLDQEREDAQVERDELKEVLKMSQKSAADWMETARIKAEQLGDEMKQRRCLEELFVKVVHGHD